MGRHVRTEPRFKVGDRVRVIDDSGGAAIGDVGTVTSAEYCDREEYYYNINGLSHDANGLFGRRLELASAFSVGDRVRLTEDNDGWGIEGDTGVILREPDYVRFDREIQGSTDWYVDPSRMVLAGDTARFAVGDRVRFVVNAKGDNNEVVGKTGTITGPRTSCYNWTVTLDEYSEYGHTGDGDIPYGYGRYAVDADLEPVDNLADEYGAAKAKFKVGDRVRFRDGYGTSSAGKEATVIKVDVWGSDGIQVDQGGKWGVSTERASNLRLVAEATSGKFKVGDRVVGTKSHVYYTVTAVRESGNLDVEADGGFHYQDNSPVLFKPATPTTMADLVRKHKPAIVARMDSGQPMPSTRPYVHGDASLAAKEAGRLANANPGKEFGVYELVSTIKVEPTYDREWQRLAKAGQKIAAIKELRGITGLTFNGAKDAVEHWLGWN